MNVVLICILLVCICVCVVFIYVIFVSIVFSIVYNLCGCCYWVCWMMLCGVFIGRCRWILCERYGYFVWWMVVVILVLLDLYSVDWIGCRYWLIFLGWVLIVLLVRLGWWFSNCLFGWLLLVGCWCILFWFWYVSCCVI